MPMLKRVWRSVVKALIAALDARAGFYASNKWFEKGKK